MGKLFGTDGIRGVANRYPMTCEMALNIGRALAFFFSGIGHHSRIVIGKDTRISGDMLESSLVAGICSMGAEALRTGVLPTPGIAFLTKDLGADAGIVISASHNPFSDNGIKVFKKDGFKLTDEEECALESLIFDVELSSKSTSIQKTGRSIRVDDAEARYLIFLKSRFPADFNLKGIRIVLDCANGASYRIAPRLFSELGAQTESLSVTPDGININEDCGSQHLSELTRKVLQSGAQIGLAFDGDADRLVAVDEKGDAVTGDQLLVICGRFMKEKKRLRNNRIVSTVMSNFGMRVALESLGIEHIVSDVGDRYVLEKLFQNEAALGGEDSGHLIFLDDHTTGDGLLAALKLLEIVKETGKKVSELCSIMRVFPQALINVKVSKKPDLQSNLKIAGSIASAQEKLDGRGRVLVRYSGTQPLCRVMVEGPDRQTTERLCLEIAETIRNELNIES
jgi:phosphoglucosamine mutase